MHRPAQRCHEGVLDRYFPALPRDRLRHELEDEPEEGPDDSTDEEGGRRTVDVDLAAGGLDPLRDEDDRQGVGERPDEERELPPAVALDQVPVALDDATERDGLVAKRRDRSRDRAHANTPLSASSSSSSSKDRP